MTAFSDAFRSEVMRMARKEIKGELESLRKTISAQRSDIAVLKRDMKAIVAQVKALNKAGGRKTSAGEVQKPDGQAPAGRKRTFHFKAEALMAKREQLGITQQSMAVLLDSSQLSVSRWESGKVMPRVAQLERIQQVLKMGKREALAKLAA